MKFIFTQLFFLAILSSTAIGQVTVSETFDGMERITLEQLLGLTGGTLDTVYSPELLDLQIADWHWYMTNFDSIYAVTTDLTNQWVVVFQGEYNDANIFLKNHGLLTLCPLKNRILDSIVEDSEYKKIKCK